MRYFCNFFIILLMGLSVEGFAQNYTMNDLCGCYRTDDSNIILNLSADGIFSIQLYHPNDILIGKWEVKKRTILLNRELSPRDSITVYHTTEGDVFSLEYTSRIEDNFTGKPYYYFTQKSIKVINANKLLYGYSVKSKRYSIKLKKGPKIYLMRNTDKSAPHKSTSLQ